MSTTDRWVTFGCFGTLIDEDDWLGANLATLAGDRRQDFLRTYLVHERLIEREQPLRLYKDVVVTALARALNELQMPLLFDERALLGVWGSMRPFADVDAMLAELRRAGWRLAVLTNCDDDLFEISHRAFSVPFDLFLTSERVRGYKPAPWHFRAFERMTGVARRNWVHVGSSWYHDVAPARALGLNHVWLDREGTGDDSGSSTVRVGSGGEIASAIGALVTRSTILESMLCAGGP